MTFGSPAQLSLADARDRAARARSQVVDGENPQQNRRAKRDAARAALTFDELCDRYIEEYAKPRKASWRDDDYRLVRARKRFGSLEAGGLTRRNIIDLLDEVKRTAPVQANRLQTTLHGVFNWAVEEELLATNLIAGMKKRAKETAKQRVLSDAEIRVLWAALDEASGERLTTVDVTDALKVLLLSGQRPIEVTGAMQTELINLASDTAARWELPSERMKKRRPHVVPLAPITRTIFANAVTRRRAEEVKAGVFASRYVGRETLARNSLSAAMKRIVPRLRAEGADADTVDSLQANPPTPHDFRRTCATGMAALGIPREDRLAVLGHLAGDVHGTVYDKYERLREKRIALEAWERHVAEVLDRAGAARKVVPMRKRGRA